MHGAENARGIHELYGAENARGIHELNKHDVLERIEQ